MRLLILLLLFLLPKIVLAHNFVVERQCKLYDNKEEKPVELGKSVENTEYKFIEFKKIHDKNYAIISKNNIEYKINEDCGYPRFDKNTKFTHLFSDDERKELKNIGEFDQEILKICGYFGSRPLRDRLGTLLSNNKFKNEFDTIYKNLSGTIKVKNSAKEIFLDELLDVLFDKGGFRHAICGTAKNSSVTHYYPRLLELDEEGFISKIKNEKCRENSPQGDVKNLPIMFTNRMNQEVIKCSNSFIKNYTAVDIISIGGLAGKTFNIQNTNASTQNTNTNNSRYQSCIYKYKNSLFNIVSYEQSLITTYPVNSTKCIKEEKNAEKCFCQFNTKNTI